MIKTVIFDLDGTLLNTLDDLADSVNYALSAFGMKKKNLEEIRSFVGNGVGFLVKRSVPEGTDPQTEKEVFSVFREHYLHNLNNKTAPYDGVTGLLERLREKGIQTAVVSNKLHEAAVSLCTDNFGDRIDCIAGACGEKDRKPCPDNVFKCMNILSAEGASTVYVGDSEVDIKTAENAGLKCVSVLWGFRTKEELVPFGGKIFISSPCELLDAIENL